MKKKEILQACCINVKETRAGVCKTLCPKHLLVPKYGQICSVVIPQKKKKNWTLLKRLIGNLLIIPYQLAKFQTSSSNLADKVGMPFAKGHNSRKKLTEFVQKLIRKTAHHTQSDDQVSSH